MEGEEKPFEFYASVDGTNYEKVALTVSRFPTELNFYGYKLPVMYQVAIDKGNHQFLKIVFGGDAQVSRVELRYGN
jgi:hypothetical protein